MSVNRDVCRFDKAWGRADWISGMWGFGIDFGLLAHARTIGVKCNGLEETWVKIAGWRAGNGKLKQRMRVIPQHTLAR